jgi:hypothetical protein
VNFPSSNADRTDAAIGLALFPCDEANITTKREQQRDEIGVGNQPALVVLVPARLRPPHAASLERAVAARPAGVGIAALFFLGLRPVAQTIQ